MLNRPRLMQLGGRYLNGQRGFVLLFACLLSCLSSGLLSNRAFATMDCPNEQLAANVTPREVGEPVDFRAEHDENSSFMQVRLRGAIRINSELIAGRKLEGLSGLAYDPELDILFAVSDRGHLFALRPRLERGHLIGVAALWSCDLKNAMGKTLAGRSIDAESLSLAPPLKANGRLTLVVGFERRPRLIRFSNRGLQLEEIPIPKRYKRAVTYANSNKAIEAVTFHPVYGWLFASEQPLRNEAPHQVPIIAAGPGTEWSYPLPKSPNAALVAMEAMPSGDLITLERDYGYFFQPLISSLRRVQLARPPKRELSVQTVAIFDSSKGWLVDNFEGLARHQGNRMFIVSDDNAHVLQTTLLAYFSIGESPSTAPKN